MLNKVQIGKPAPPFRGTAVVDGRFKGTSSLLSHPGRELTTLTEVSLTSYTDAHHWLILIFFPKAWSFICPTEIKAFSARLEEFLYSRSCAVLFASTDSEHCLKAWNATSDMEGGLGGVHVPLLSDITRKISSDYGVLIEEEGVAQRALFIIDPKGNVRAVTVNDADVGRSVDEARRVLDALMFKDEFGEGCPVDWKKGDKGIDIASKTKLEGELQVAKKSWSEWARPKLSRAFSAQSAKSLTSEATVGHSPEMRGVVMASLNAGVNSPPQARSLRSDSLESSLMSPTSAKRPSSLALEDKVLQQRLENLEAAVRNQNLGVGIAS